MLYQELSFSGEGKYWIRTNYKCFAEQILKVNRVASTSFLSLRNRRTRLRFAEARRCSGGTLVPEVLLYPL